MSPACNRFAAVCPLMLQQDGDGDGDYVVATGETHSIRELLDVALEQVGRCGRGTSPSSTAR